MRFRSSTAMVIAMTWAACQGLSTIALEGSATTTVEEGSILEELIGDIGFDEFLEMDLMQSQELRNQGVEPGDVREVYLTSFTLTAESPPGGDLSFLESMSLYVESDGLDRVRIAHADDFPEGQAEVVFELDDVDLTAYATAPSMTITTEVTGHRPDETTEVRADYIIDVVVTAQGACSAL